MPFREFAGRIKKAAQPGAVQGQQRAPEWRQRWPVFSNGGERPRNKRARIAAQAL